MLASKLLSGLLIMGHMYLGGFTGTGRVDTVFDPFRVDAKGQQPTGVFDLRSTKPGSGKCLITVPVRDDTIGIYLGSDFDTPSAVVKTALQNFLGKTLQSNTPRLQIAEALIAKLSPTIQGMIELWLDGGLFFSQRVIAGGSVGDNFTDVDGTFITAHTPTGIGGFTVWNQISRVGATNGYKITSNKIGRQANSNDESHRAEVDLASADHYAQCSFPDGTFPGGTPIPIGVICRFDPSATNGNTNWNWYGAYYGFQPVPGTYGAIQLHKVVNQVFTQLLSTTQLDPGVGDILRLECNGTSLTVKLAGATVLGPTSDGDVVGFKRPGLWGNGASGGGPPVIDDFQADVLAAPAAGDDWMRPTWHPRRRW